MRLCINIDHIATLRNARGGEQPDPLEAAKIVERAGADGIVCHLREDRRHMKDRDVKRLRESIRTKLDLEMASTGEMVRNALRISPDLVTLVPEKRQELTTEGGLNVVRLKGSLKNVIRKFHEKDIPVSLFVDPVREQIEAAKEIEADMIEIHTGEYANAGSGLARLRHLSLVREMAAFGKELELIVNAGHGLDYENIHPLTSIAEIEEVSIGHAVIARAVVVGLDRAVREMLRLVRGRK